MVWKSLVSYGSVLTMAAQSSRWEQAMNTKLVEMALAAEKAAAMQRSAATHQSMATEAEEQATAEQARAEELEGEAAALLEKSEADGAIAAGEQVEVEGLEAQGLAEEEQSVAHGAAAALDESTFEGEMAEATTDAVAAAQREAQAHGEEVGIGVCEFVPFLDIACDIIGAITAVGLEGLSSSKAIKASTELAAATATKAEEAREIALAARFQAKAAEDAAAAAELQADEVTEAELAEEEQAAAEAKEAEADALLEHAELEDETAAEEEAMAAAQQVDAGTLAVESVVKGVLSCWDAIMASLFGMVSIAFFSFRLITNYVPPAVAVILSARSTPETTLSTLSNRTLWRDISYKIQHLALFTLLAGIFSNIFSVMDQTSLQARGGIILIFSFSGACIQTVLLHALPAHLTRSQNVGAIFTHGARSVISLSVLYTLELLILWAIFGQRIFTAEWFRGLHNRMWWAIFFVPFAVHLWYLEIPLLKRQKDTNIGASNRKTEDTQCNATEADALLPIKRVDTDDSPTVGREKTSWFGLLRKDLARMQLPFEILITSCMLGLLIHCVAAAGTLWPTSKALLLSHRPNWLLPLACELGILALGGIVLSIIFWRRSNSGTR